VLPPGERAALDGRPVALFVGDRTWPPNAAAARSLVAVWPQVSGRVPDAELVLAGRPPRRERQPVVPGVRSLGFVADIDSVFAAATVLVAPVTIGGGVRVKILEAAARGIPVVATKAAVGSIDEYLPIEPVAGAELAQRAAALLADRARARAEGAALFDANRERWRSGFVHRGVEAWLERGLAARPPATPAAPGGP
jgi:glycosyltransferase involved in cell wall biosynthesis